MKLPEIGKNGQKIAENSRKLPKQPEIAITFYWIVILTSIFLFGSRTYHKTYKVTRNCQKWLEIVEKGWKLPFLCT